MPIRLGGYANASEAAIQVGYQCACLLKDIVSPYLLRRLKVDVAADLPKKSEQVLFCKLTVPQCDAYQAYLNSKDCEAMRDGDLQVFSGIDQLRKICNHPDLANRNYLMQVSINYSNKSLQPCIQVANMFMCIIEGGIYVRPCKSLW